MPGAQNRLVLKGHWAVITKGVFDVSGGEAISFSDFFSLPVSLRATSEVCHLAECPVRNATNQELRE